MSERNGYHTSEPPSLPPSNHPQQPSEEGSPWKTRAVIAIGAGTLFGVVTLLALRGCDAPPKQPSTSGQKSIDDIKAETARIRLLLRADDLYKQAEQALKDQDDDRAFALLQESVSLDPTRLDSQKLLADIYARRKQHAEGHALWSRLLERKDLKPEHLVVLYAMRGLFSEQIAQWERAEADYTAAIAEFEKTVVPGGKEPELHEDDLYFYRANVRAAQKKVEEAKADCRHAIGLGIANTGSRNARDLLRTLEEKK